MLRFFVLLLMFVVVFLSGMLFGIDREHAQFNIPEGFELSKPEKIEDTVTTTTEKEEIIIVDQAVDMETPVHFTQKDGIDS